MSSISNFGNPGLTLGLLRFSGEAKPKVVRTPQGDEWLVGRTFAVGGFGTVRPVLRLDGTRGVVKRVRPFLALDIIRNEVETLKVLDAALAPFEVTQSPHKVNIFMPAMSMSLVELDLSDSAADDVAKMMLRELAQRLAAFSKRGYVHLDIKEHNILIDKEGALHVCDTGLAEAISSWAFGWSGTWGWMAPERRSIIPQSNAKADVWSLAETIERTCFKGRPAPADVALLLQAMKTRNWAQRPSMDDIAEQADRLQPSTSDGAQRARARLRDAALLHDRFTEVLRWAPLERERQRYEGARARGEAYEFNVQEQTAVAWAWARVCPTLRMAHNAAALGLFACLGIIIGRCLEPVVLGTVLGRCQTG